MQSRTLEFIKILIFGETHLKDIWHELPGPKNGFFPEGFDGVSFEMVHPLPKNKGPYLEYIRNQKMEDPGKAINNSISLAMLLNYRGKKVMLGGDVLAENWREHKRMYQKSGNNIESDIVKLPHHGSKLDCPPDVMTDFFSDTNET